jgi:enoyl-CoA hydratase/carnithine racemase
MTRPIRFEADGRYGQVLLDRPETGNTINVEAMRSFIESLTAAHDAGIDVLKIRSTGSDFSLGRDQTEKSSGLSKRDNLGLILEANALLTDFSGVTVAEVRGRALGFGCGVATQCDITVASDDSLFGFTEVLHGFAPAIVMTYLETYVGRKVAVDLLMTGRSVPAREAQEMGLVTRVVPAAELGTTAESLVQTLLAAPASVLQQCKFFLREIGDVSAGERGMRALDALTE